jgi:peroxiredoxin/protocatechuate 3,4-dioxygenase beta subunit
MRHAALSRVTIAAVVMAAAFLPAWAVGPAVAGEEPAAATAESPASLVFKGKVIGPDGKPLPGARVFVKGEPQRQVTANRDGTFELPLAGSKPGGSAAFILVEARHPDLPGCRGVLTKQFNSESDAEGVIEMKRTGTVTGRVVDAANKPIQGATVSAVQIFFWDTGGGQALLKTEDSTTTSNESGRYEIKALASGVTYTVEATARGHGLDRAMQFSVSEGAVYDLPVLALRVADMSIEGTVTDADGNPVAGGTVMCSGSETPARFTKTDERGRYRLDQLVNGSFLVSAYSGDRTLLGQERALAGDTQVDIVLVRKEQFSPKEREREDLAGKQAPELQPVTWINCEPLNLASLRGKTVMLVFWDTTNEACTELGAALNTLMTDYSGKGVEILSIHAAGADVTALKQFVSDHGITFRVALDKPATNKMYKGATFEKYTVRTVPSVFIIDAEGKIRYQDVPLRAVEEALKATLAEK